MVSQTSHQQETVHISDHHNHSLQHQIQPIMQSQQSIDFEHNNLNNYVGGNTISPPPNFASFDNEKSIISANSTESNPILINGQSGIHHTHGFATKKPKKKIVLEVLSLVYGENNQPVIF